MKIKLAGLIVELNSPDSLISENYKDFICDENEEVDVEWNVVKVEDKNFPTDLEWNTIGGFRTAKRDGNVYIEYMLKDYHIVDSIMYSNDYQKAEFYIPETITDNENYDETVKGCLFMFQREALFLASLKNGGVSIHSATIIYNDKAYVCSAMSGTGKSTHTNMWNKMYKTPILDGDLTICRLKKDGVYAYGLPWCGTSNLYINKEVKVGGIVFLEQYTSNDVASISDINFIKRMYARSFTPTWFEELSDQMLNIIMGIAKQDIGKYVLKCLANEEAVDVLKSVIDNN